MFTGIVTAVGTVRSVKATPRGLRLAIAAPYKGLAIGESIAVDGACLTVVAKTAGAFSVEAIATTRGRTKVEDYAAGSKVNLERALALGDRLGGHLVSGHVDGTGTVERRTAKGESVLLDIKAPSEIYRLCVLHGSIAVDGVSLTVNALSNGKAKHRSTDAPMQRKTANDEIVQVALIPHTLESTTLGDLAVGDRVHLESDQLAKFAQRLLEPYRATARTRER
jgi:riboflavin synthase